jgi:hypothetical protein
MNKTRDGTRDRNGSPSVRTSIVPAFSAAFWPNWLLAAMAGEIAGHALNHIYFHRSGRVIVALMMQDGMGAVCRCRQAVLHGDDADRRLRKLR